MLKKHFAGFIMTYNRSEIIADTIQKVFDQSLPPEKLLIVDNSDNDKTKKVIKTINDNRVCYYQTGYNAGPAGGSKIGLQKLSQEGYDWIYWGDDDDPPAFQNEFEHLLGIAREATNCAAVGSSGNKFDRQKGRFIRYKNDELKGVLEVDAIGGNENIIVNGGVVRETGILPTAEPFFGFEDVDFFLRLRDKNYRILVSGKSLYNHRQRAGRMHIKSTRNIKRKIDVDTLWRQYYSFRSLIYIFKYNLKDKRLVFKFTLRAIAKSIFGFAHGFKYGKKNAEYLLKAILHAYQKKMEKRV
jgi:GT2 family glycosyltransferase